jgi:hypothetical protein
MATEGSIPASCNSVARRGNVAGATTTFWSMAVRSAWSSGEWTIVLVSTVGMVGITFSFGARLGSAELCPSFWSERRTSVEAGSTRRVHTVAEPTSAVDGSFP